MPIIVLGFFYSFIHLFISLTFWQINLTHIITWIIIITKDAFSEQKKTSEETYFAGIVQWTRTWSSNLWQGPSHTHHHLLLLFSTSLFCPSIVSWVGLVRFAFNQEEEKNNNGRKSRMIHTMYSIYIRMRVWYRYWCWYCDTSIHISQVEGESEEEQSHSKNSDLLFLSQVLLFGSCVWAVFSFHHHFYFFIS